jgi:phosphoribosylamine---glycine ligase
MLNIDSRPSIPDDGEIETAGGRVLGVTARASTLEESTMRAYEAVGKIRFDGTQFRKGIGAAL